MRAYLANLTPKARMLLAVPVVVIAYMVVTMVIPAAFGPWCRTWCARAAADLNTASRRDEPWSDGRLPIRPGRSPAEHGSKSCTSSDTLLRGLSVPTTNDQRPTTGSDELWMEEALRAAQRALEAGEVPVGAVVVCEERIIGRGWNRNIGDSDPTAHAEIVALREAGAAVGNHRLADCDLFATIEPCPMCAGAMVHARIKRLVYGADDPKAGAVHLSHAGAKSPATESQSGSPQRRSGRPLRRTAANVLQESTLKIVHPCGAGITPPI